MPAKSARGLLSQGRAVITPSCAGSRGAGRCPLRGRRRTGRDAPPVRAARHRRPRRHARGRRVPRRRREERADTATQGPRNRPPRRGAAPPAGVDVRPARLRGHGRRRPQPGRAPRPRRRTPRTAARTRADRRALALSVRLADGDRVERTRKLPTPSGHTEDLRTAVWKSRDALAFQRAVPAGSP